MKDQRELNFIIAFCGREHEELNIPYEEVFSIIDKYAQLTRLINRSHSKSTDLKIAFKAAEKGSLETCFKIFEIVKDVSQLPFNFSDIQSSLLLAAQDAGILSSNSLSIIDFLIALKGKKVTDRQIIDQQNSNNLTIVRNDGNITVNNFVFNSYNDQDVRKVISELGEEINQSQSFESLEIRDPIEKKVITRILKKDVPFLKYDEESDFDVIDEHEDIVSIISSYFVGNSQWNFKNKDKVKFKARITDLDWLDGFQKGRFSINTRFKLRVSVVQKYKLIKNLPPQLMSTEISKIHEIIKPLKQGDFL